jgi:hypothetical protein
MQNNKFLFFYIVILALFFNVSVAHIVYSQFGRIGIPGGGSTGLPRGVPGGIPGGVPRPPSTPPPPPPTIPDNVTLPTVPVGVLEEKARQMDEVLGTYRTIEDWERGLLEIYFAPTRAEAWDASRDLLEKEVKQLVNRLHSEATLRLKEMAQIKAAQLGQSFAFYWENSSQTAAKRASLNGIYEQAKAEGVAGARSWTPTSTSSSTSRSDSNSSTAGHIQMGTSQSMQQLQGLASGSLRLR